MSKELNFNESTYFNYRLHASYLIEDTTSRETFQIMECLWHGVFKNIYIFTRDSNINSMKRIFMNKINDNTCFIYNDEHDLKQLLKIITPQDCVLITECDDLLFESLFFNSEIYTILNYGTWIIDCQDLIKTMDKFQRLKNKVDFFIFPKQKAEAFNKLSEYKIPIKTEHKLLQFGTDSHNYIDLYKKDTDTFWIAELACRTSDSEDHVKNVKLRWKATLQDEDNQDTELVSTTIFVDLPKTSYYELPSL